MSGRNGLMPPISPDGVACVTFYFDPACPWTWLTSRWLVDAAGLRGVPIEYSALELSDGGAIDDVPVEHREGVRASRAFLRGVMAARRTGRHDVIGRWYTAFGTARWIEGRPSSLDLVRTTLSSAGGSDLAWCLDDTSIDEAVAASRTEAERWVGDDAGTPVTVWTLEHAERGFFGPVMAPQPVGARSDALWSAMVNAARVPELFELKSRRTRKPLDPPLEIAGSRTA